MSRRIIQILFLVSSLHFYQVFTYYPVPSLIHTRMFLKHPHQVHISLSGKRHMRISWISVRGTIPSIVYYGTSPQNYTCTANGTYTTYHYARYKSGDIHNVLIGPLNPNTLYFYRCGFQSDSPEFTFKTPPSKFPLKFAVTGDLGQTNWSKCTLDRIGKSKYDVLLFSGDLAYADYYQPKWDKFGVLVEPQASQRPWMVTHGNHEIEKIKGSKYHRISKFTSYNARWVMPYQECASPTNLFYSFDVAGVHVLMLGSYVDFGQSSAQFRWLREDLNKVDRKRTPWLVAVVHAPWYNTNAAHQREYESFGMKEAMEDVLFKARVDVVFAGHVHAYERFVRVYKDRANECGPMYITVGAGGNHEGLAIKFMVPQPKISAFRESVFGHGQLSIMNATHGIWTWHRNNEHVNVASDKVLIRSLASIPTCNKI